MKRKRTYATVDVENFDVALVMPLLTMSRIIAIDVAKTKFVAAVATAAGEVLKLIRFEHPRQTAVFLRILSSLSEAQRKPQVVMEPTGTYGDALRHQVHRLGVPVHMMPPKHTHDFAEVMDGVPSMHDGKAAVVLATLQAIKPAGVWVPESDARRNLRAWVDQRAPIGRILALYHGHLEATLARHWPEVQSLIDVSAQRSWIPLMKEFPGPQAIAEQPDRAAQTLRKASRQQLSADRVEAIVNSAKVTMGLPMLPGEQEKLRAIVEQIDTQSARLAEIDHNSKSRSSTMKFSAAWPLSSVRRAPRPSARSSARQPTFPMPERSKRRWA